MAEWKRERIERAYQPAEGLEARHGGLSSTLLRLIREESLHKRTVLDVGCGTGRLSFALAAEAGRIIGIDWSEPLILQAQQQARTRSLHHVTFVCGDAEQIEYRDLGPIDLVVAHLCMSNEILRRAAAVLNPGRFVAFTTLHRDQWKESGRSSRFAYGEEDLETALVAAGFDPVYLGVEHEVLSFADPDQALTYVEASGITEKWKSDSRWEGFVAYLKGGGRHLTARARVNVKARRR